MDLENLTKENWKKSALKLAKEKFPVGSLVKFHYPLQYTFGKIEKITPSGRIYVVPGDLGKVKCELHGAYWEIDYTPKNFTPRDFLGHEVIQFMPHFYDYPDKRITWQGSGNTVQYACLEQLKPNEDGLVHDTVLNY